MDYNLIVACSNNYGIGNNGKLPWNIPNDLKRFSQLTKGKGNNAIIMGRKTWDSLPIKPLPNRINIVLTSNHDLIHKYKDDEQIIFLPTFDDIDEFCKFEGFDEVWIIGGVSIYKHYINSGKVKAIYMTYINKHFNCDTNIDFINNINNPYQIIEKIVDKYENIDIYYIKLILLKKNKQIHFTYSSWNNKEVTGTSKIINWIPIGQVNENNYLIFIKDESSLTSDDIKTICGTSITHIS